MEIHKLWTCNLGQMHKGPLIRIGDAMAKNFMGDPGNVSLAQNQKAEHVPDGVPFCPFEIYMRASSGYIPYVNQECGNCIGNGRTGSTQDSVLANTSACDLQRGLKFRRIDPVDFQKEQLLASAEIVRHPCERISRFVLLD